MAKDGLRHEVTYEGQAGIELEAVGSYDSMTYPFDFRGSEPFEIDLRGMIRAVVSDVLHNMQESIISPRFHRSFEQIIVDSCVRIRDLADLKPRPW